MNENTTKLLEKLADKLGTTSEYLWLVLLKQAPITATIDLIRFVLTIIFGWILWKIHKKLMKKNNSNDRYAENIYKKSGLLAAFPMVLFSMIFAVLFIFNLCCIEDIINGFFHPEYWALQDILSNVK